MMSSEPNRRRKSPPEKVLRFFELLLSKSPRDRFVLINRMQQVPLIGALMKFFFRQRARFVQRTPEDYVQMQKREYEVFAALGEVTSGDMSVDAVVGTWRQHDEWPDYDDYLMRYVPKDESWTALEYGCGPGRNIRRWSEIFRRVDGVDISPRNLENARTFIHDQVPPHKAPNLFPTNGMDCGDAPKGAYDFAFSTICLQHICVHSVRYAIFVSLFECLKPGGRLSVQMGFGVPSPHSVGYYDDFVQAVGTNRACDAAITSPDQVRGDLENIGFTNFESWVRPVGPGDLHPQWIFFTATKPGGELASRVIA